jgi:2-dehydropantoate 2-reductase
MNRVITVRACVFGAGAIGCLIGASLARAGARVSLIARGPHLEAIHRRGVTVLMPEGDTRHFEPDRASDDPAHLGVQDIVIVAVKTTGLRAIARQIAPLLSPTTSVVFVTNGIPWWYPDGGSGPLGSLPREAFDPDGLLHGTVDRSQVIGGVIYSACTVVEPGVIRSASRSNRLIIGDVDPEQSRSAGVAALICDGGLVCQPTCDIRREVWSKLMTNLASAPICLLSRRSMAVSFADPVIRQAAIRLVDEGSAIAAALLGSPLPATAEEIVSMLAGIDHKPSILQDFELGRPMEIDALLTDPQRLARFAGIETPLLDLLAALARQATDVAGISVPGSNASGPLSIVR